MEKEYGESLEHLSSAKSPMMMFGAVAKTVYPKVAGVSPDDIVTVAIMPCTAKKAEIQRKEMLRDGKQDVDYVLTTRELIKLIKSVGLTFNDLPESDFDSPLGEATGAGAIFGATGGVMEAALRTVYEKATGKTLEKIDFEDVRGMQGIKEATVDLGSRTVHIAVAHTLKNAAKLMKDVRSGTSPYDFIEVMACPGGCVGGGGQPIGTTRAVTRERIKAIYEIDKSLPRRKSHENPVIQKLYADHLDAPLSEKAHALLHTHYTPVPPAYEF